MDFIQSNVLDLGWRGSFQHHLCPIKYDTIALYEFLSWSITVFWVYKAWPLLWKNIGELDLNKFISTLIPCHMIPVDGPYFFISIFQELIFFFLYIRCLVVFYAGNWFVFELLRFYNTYWKSHCTHCQVFWTKWIWSRWFLNNCICNYYWPFWSNIMKWRLIGQFADFALFAFWLAMFLLSGSANWVWIISPGSLIESIIDQTVFMNQILNSYSNLYIF